MTIKILYLVPALLLGGCSGVVDLGNGDSGSEAGVGNQERSPDAGSSVLATDEAGQVVEPDSGIGQVSGPGGGASTEPSDAGISSLDGNCLPNCSLEAGPPFDGGYTLCGETECGPGESCVATNTSGGPCIPPGDGGSCPKGTVLDGGCCVAAPSTLYVCQITPASCGGELTCACSSSLCSASDGCFCAGVTNNVLTCNCEAP
jgi:hypothetical protein